MVNTQVRLFLKKQVTGNTAEDLKKQRLTIGEFLIAMEQDPKLVIDFNKYLIE